MRSDFGFFSVSALHSVAPTEVGTPYYCAPEVSMRATMDACYDGKKADSAPCNSSVGRMPLHVLTTRCLAVLACGSEG